MTETIRILMIDDHPMIIEGYQNTLQFTKKESQKLDIAKGLERLHKDITVGTGRLFYTLNTFKEDPVANRFFESSEYNSLVEKYGDVFAQFEVIDIYFLQIPP